MRSRIGFFVIRAICRALVLGRHNTTTDRLDVAARLYRLAQRIRTNQDHSPTRLHSTTKIRRFVQ